MRTIVLLVMMSLGAFTARAEVRVLAWSERSEPVEVYPQGINGVVADLFADTRRVKVTIANLLDPGQGLSEEALLKTDVLVWFGHRNHGDVLDENVRRVVRHVVERGLGFLPLHSAHYARPFQQLMRVKASEAGLDLDDPLGKWERVRNDGAPETIRILRPDHPIAKGVSDFVIPATEMYINPFHVPPPDEKILEGSWQGGEQQGNDGLIWYIGRGKVFYFRPGHETHPIYLQPEVQQILRNAILWLSKRGKGSS